jgi:hypothetical protein
MAAVVTAAFAGTAGDDSAAPALGSDASVAKPITAAMIANFTASERRLNLNIPGPSRTITSMIAKRTIPRDFL